MNILRRISRHTTGASAAQWLFGIFLLSAVLPLLAIHDAFASLLSLGLCILLLIFPFSRDMISLATALVVSQQWPSEYDRADPEGIRRGRSKMIFGLLLISLGMALIQLGMRH